MDESPQLQLYEILEFARGSLTCVVRCVAGTVRLGDTVELIPAGSDRPVAQGLSIAAIEFIGGRRMDFVDLGRSAEVTVAGPINHAALRAVVAGNGSRQVVPADLRLVVR